MKSIYSGEENNIDMSRGIGIALGNFDGLHIGHMELVNRVVALSRKKRLKSLLYTFSNHPENIIAQKVITPLITTNQIKIDILNNSNLDYLYFEDFNEEYMKMKPREFIQKIIVEKFNAKLVVVGFHYHFGYKGAGDISLLKRLGDESGFEVYVVEPIKVGDIIVSSSAIRTFLKNGDVEKAAIFMNRKYAIKGKVLKGKTLGRQIGFPTINLIPDATNILPSKGVYLTQTIIDNHCYHSVTNIGTNPTVENERIKIETHLLDFNGDLYGKKVEVHFIKKLRNEVKFESVQSLTAQIALDVQYAKDYFG